MSGSAGPGGATATQMTTSVDVTPLPDAAARPPDVPAMQTGPQPLGSVSLSLGSEPAISAFAGVGFALNPITVINGTYKGSPDNTPGDYQAQVNWGDGPQWDTNTQLAALTRTRGNRERHSRDRDWHGCRDECTKDDQ